MTELRFYFDESVDLAVSEQLALGNCWKNGTNSIQETRAMSVKERSAPLSVAIHSGRVWVTLDNQRVIGLPLDPFPWLANATPEQQRNYQANPISIYWPDLEDGIDLEYFTGEWPLPPAA